MRFVLRVRAWEYRQLATVHKCTRSSRADKARKLGYKRAQGYSIWRCRVRRGARRCGGLRVLNSYWVGQDAANKFYEVILVDPSHKRIRRNPEINWIVSSKHGHRECRGLTAAGKKTRGLQKKGFKATKIRPSKNANWKRRNTQKMWRFRSHQ